MKKTESEGDCREWHMPIQCDNGCHIKCECECHKKCHDERECPKCHHKCHKDWHWCPWCSHDLLHECY